MSDYPPGSAGRLLDDFAAAAERMPWPVRWYWCRKARHARAHFDRARDESLAVALERMGMPEHAATIREGRLA